MNRIKLKGKSYDYQNAFDYGRLQKHNGIPCMLPEFANKKYLREAFYKGYYYDAQFVQQSFFDNEENTP